MTQAISMYGVLVPPSVRLLGSLSVILDKAAAHAEARKIDPLVLVGSRLFPDMLPLRNQIQIASDALKGAAARLSGSDAPSWPDDEKTIDDLKVRIAKTIDYLNSFKPEQIDGSEHKAISFKTRAGELNFTGQDYLLLFALPNLYFHVTTAYNILRHNGVEIGKFDYLGRR